jgi:integrase
MQDTAGFRLAGTFLSDAQLREAEAAFLRLKDLPLPKTQSVPRPLAFYLDYTLANHKEPSADKTIAEAQKEYCQQRKVDWEKGLIGDSTLRTITSHMKNLDAACPGMLVSELSAEKITAICSAGEVGNITHNHRRDMISGFLTFAMKKEWIAKNPIDKVPRYPTTHKRGSAAALSSEQARELMEYLEVYEGGRFVPFYALALFAGIRPDAVKGELSKLSAQDVHLETGVIHIEPWVSKVKMKRNVIIQPNRELIRWTSTPLSPQKCRNIGRKSPRNSTSATIYCGTRSSPCTSRNSVQWATQPCKQATPKWSSAATTST